MSRDADGERAAAMGARRALAAISHELASPLTALHTYLRLANGDNIEPIRACAQRIKGIVELARDLAQLGEATQPAQDAAGCDLVLALESAAAKLAVAAVIDASGPLLVRVAPARAGLITVALLRAVMDAGTSSRIVMRAERRGDRIWMRIDPGTEPTRWRSIDPWRTGTGQKLDLWAAAVAAGEGSEVRVGELEGQIAVEAELPAAEAR